MIPLSEGFILFTQLETNRHSIASCIGKGSSQFANILMNLVAEKNNWLSKTG